jgi:hypothetical protein
VPTDWVAAAAYKLLKKQLHKTGGMVFASENNMKRTVTLILAAAAFTASAQKPAAVKPAPSVKPPVAAKPVVAEVKPAAPVDTVLTGKVTIVKDPRLDILAKKEAEYNAVTALGPRAAKGYRLMVLNSNDRDYAMRVRASLLQYFPEQKVYMTFQAPFIKLKFGNFLEKGDAEKYKKMITAQKIVTNNVYVVPEVIEVKPDKNKESEEEK